MIHLYKIILFVVIIIGLGCASLKFQEDISLYHNQIEELNSKLLQNPNDAEAFRDLGVIYFQVGEYIKAREFLRKSIKLNPDDPKTLFYVGLSAEFDRENQLALRIYEKYPEISKLSPYRKLMAGRYRWLTREIAREEIKMLQRDPSKTQIIPEVVAVFPLIYKGKDKEFSSLGRGVAEMILIDLGKVSSLQIVERIRIQAILDELNLSKEPYIDPQSSPRHGKLLGAGKVVGGDFNILSDKQLYMNISYWEVARGEIPSVSSQQDLLDNLFTMEKDIVLELIERMGIELTQKEHEAIEFIPTKNLQAFLAYCKGLESEDNGRYNEAIKYYQRAGELDPSFQMSESKMDEISGLSAVGSNTEDTKAFVRKIDPMFSPSVFSGESLVTERLQNLSNSVGSNFIPGEDTRKPAEEAAQSLDLPEPPPPPNSD